MKRYTAIYQVEIRIEANNEEYAREIADGVRMGYECSSAGINGYGSTLTKACNLVSFEECKPVRRKRKGDA